MAKNLELDLAVKLDTFRRELAAIPNLTADQAKAMTDAMNRELRKQTSQLRTENRTRAGLLKQAAKDNEEAARAIEKAGDKLSGGMLGDVKDYASGLSALGTTLGPIAGLAGAAGIGLTAYTGALTAAVTGTIALTREAGEAAARLEEMGVASQLGISEEMLLNVEDANRSLDTLNVISDAVTVRFANELAPAVVEVSTAVGAAALRILDMANSFSDAVESSQALWFVLNAFTGGGANQMAAAFAHVTEFGSDYRDEMDDLTAAVGAAGDKHEEAKVKTKDTWRKPKEEAQDYGRALDTLWGIINQNQEAQFEGEQLLRIQAQNRIEDINRIATEYADSADVQMMAADAMLAVEENTQRQITEIHQREIAAREQELQAMGDRVMEQMVAYTGQVQQMWSDVGQLVADSTIGAVETISQGISDMYAQSADNAAAYYEGEQAQLDDLKAYKEQHWAEMDAGERAALQAKINMQKEETNRAKEASDRRAKQSRDAAIASFIVSRAAAVATSAVAGIQATALALASPPGPPMNTPIVLATGITAALNTALIAASPPPKFHTGSYISDGPDEMNAIVRAGEYVMSPRGVVAAGGPQALDQMNAGRSMGGSGPQNIYATLMLGDREIGMLRAEVQSRPSRQGRDIGWSLQKNTRGDR